MARVHYGSFMQDKNGAPVAGASISVFLAGTNVPAAIYTSEISGTPLITAPQLTTNAMGYFEFGIADESDSNGVGYPTSQKFKLAGERVGVASGMIDYVDIFPIVMPVDLDSDDTTRNKAISNALAKKGNKITLLQGNEEFLGSIEAGDSTSEDDNRNKLVSNGQIMRWQDHRKMNFNTSLTVPADLSDEDALPGENKELFPDLYGAHGILPIDLGGLNRSDPAKNRLISNVLGNKGDEHVNYSFFEHDISEEGFSEPTAHGLARANFSIPPFDLTDPNAPADLVYEYNQYNKLVSNRLIRELMYDSEIKASVTVRKVKAEEGKPSMFESNIYYYTVTHNLNTKFVGVTMSRLIDRINPSTGEVEFVDTVYSPEDIFLLDNDVIEIHSSKAVDCYITVYGRKDLLKAMNEDSGTGGGTEPVKGYWKLMFNSNVPTAKIHIPGMILSGADAEGGSPVNGDFYLQTGNYTVEFSEVPGYVTPETMNFLLNYNKLVEVEYLQKKFKVTFDSNMSDTFVKLHTDIEGTPISEGLSLTNGTYVIEFSEKEGYKTPATKVLTINNSDVVVPDVKGTSLIPTYVVTFKTNILNVDVHITGSDGNESYIPFYDGKTIELEQDIYTFVFSSVPGMKKPDDITLTLNSDTTIAATYEIL